ncbi:MAG: hypothetical protein M1829_004490 [Trizodia sp. TS-e1964]|nr:MAG: hypothetical protein M1829_004490 [Trizodia sp. TS-e1964]
MQEQPPAGCVNSVEDDNRPLAVRRKRRGSSSTSVPKNNGTPSGLPDEQNNILLTPRKVKKRVRFSDPGPELIDRNSSGLTPAIRRYSLNCFKEPISQDTAMNPISPQVLSTSKRISSLDFSRSGSPPSGIIQFEPFRQVLSDRTKRRIRRNNLSEELNSIEHEKREVSKQRKDEVKRLKEEVLDQGLKLTALSQQLDLARRSSECAQLPPQHLQSYTALSGRHFEPEDRSGVDIDSDMWSNYDGDSHMMDDPGAEPHSTPFQISNMDSFETTSTIPVLFNTQASTQVNLPDPNTQNQLSALNESIHNLNAALERSKTNEDRLAAKLLPYLPAPNSLTSDQVAIEDALDNVITQLVLAKSKAKNSSTIVSALNAEILSLGFSGKDTDEMLQTIRDQFRQARLELEYIEPGETVISFDNNRLLSLLVDRIRTLLRRNLENKEEFSKQMQQHHDTLKGANSEALAASNKAIELQEELNTQIRSNGSLQRALEGYRTEVKGLEKLITKMEAQHEDFERQCQMERDEAVADLEGKLNVERVRAMDTRLELEKALQHTAHVRNEMQSFLDEKVREIAELQNVTRLTERSYEHDLAKKQSLIASLQEETRSLHTSINELKSSVDELSSTKLSLEEQVGGERRQGLQAVEAMQVELTRALSRIGDVKNNYITQWEAGHEDEEEGTYGKEPLTPSSLMSSAPGSAAKSANMGRAKRRKYDSGIGILEEEDEVEASAV